MFQEFVEMFFTPASPIAKKYGFLYHSISLKHRYERCKRNWLPHLKNCQEVFEIACADLENKKSVVILGAAHLHEIPLHLLKKHFQEITLVDIIHPLKHHMLAKRDKSIKLVTMDLGNTLDKLEDLKTLEALQEHLTNQKDVSLFNFKADLIVSANIMSQLGLLPIEAIEKFQKKDLTIHEKDSICTQFAELHLKNLLNCNGKVLIYSDREVIYRDKNKEIIYQGSYPVDLGAFKKIREWIWELAPIKEASKNHSIEMKVEAYLH